MIDRTYQGRVSTFTARLASWLHLAALLTWVVIAESADAAWSTPPGEFDSRIFTTAVELDESSFDNTWIPTHSTSQSYFQQTDPPLFNAQFTAVQSEPESQWTPQILPQGIIYKSYWAGLHEPRMGLQVFSEESGGKAFWDPTLGARVGLFRFGNNDPLSPQGLQLDVEGAALARLTLDEWRDLESVDFRGGIPLTYGINNWQFKLGYYHLSSHLGDEHIINNPGSAERRLNYVRDAIVVGASWYPLDVMRLYGETAYAFNATGGAEPLEFQFGTELSQPGITSSSGSPFLALNGHLREEHNFGGDFTGQLGWLWRNEAGQVLRVGTFYFNGKSSQYQFYDDSEQQIGVGMWFDF